MDGKGAKADRAVAQIAERQHGVISIGQLRAAGVSEDAVRARVQAGRLHRLHQGVYAVGHRAVSSPGTYMAAVLACGGTLGAGGIRTDNSRGTVLGYWRAAISHRSAGVLWELLPDIDAPVDIAVPGDGGRKNRRGIRLHRSLTLSPAAVTLRGGIPVTTPGRTIWDLGRAVSGRTGRHLVTEKELRKAIRQADVLGLPLGDEVGVPLGDEVGRDRSRSDLEGDFLKLCRRHRLPRPEVNVRIGRDLVDFLWRRPRLIVETDGYIYHRGRVAFENDRKRDLRLRAAGFDVMRVSEKQVDNEPGRVAEAVAAALRVGADG